MIKTLLILGLLSGFGLMLLGVIALFSNYAELIMPSYIPLIIISGSDQRELRSVCSKRSNEADVIPQP